MAANTRMFFKISALAAILSQKGNSWIKSIVFFIFFSVFLYYFLSHINYRNTLSEIKNGSLIFTPDIGWTSRKHANPTGPTTFLSKYKAPVLRKNDTITYAQLLGNFPFIPKSYRLKIEKKYILLKDVSGLEKDQLLFYIFKDVSELFEETQGKIPFYFVDLAYSSSFSPGDLTGNLIAYYCAFNNVSIENLLMQYPSVPKADALKKIKEGDFKREKEWINSSDNTVLSDFHEKYSADFDSANILKSISVSFSQIALKK